ncbi:hypothetical protein J1614_010689 [Plenodomus biglobosus]|nr:hypothetical protein J1614_010689 [Plenodomus biglobosus]
MVADEIPAHLPEYEVLCSFATTGEPFFQYLINNFVEPVSTGILNDDQDSSEYVWSTCSTIVAAAGATAHSHQISLVEFVLMLQQQTLRMPETDEVLQHENEIIWRDLPVFGWVVRGAWNIAPSDPGVTAPQNKAWENLNAFVARLTAEAGVREFGDCLDYALYGLWALRDVFEEVQLGLIPGTETLRAACMWMLYAPDALWKNRKVGRKFEARVGAGGRLFADRGWLGFTQERWAVWIEGLMAAERASDEQDLKQVPGETAWCGERVQSFG